MIKLWIYLFDSKDLFEFFPKFWPLPISKDKLSIIAERVRDENLSVSIRVKFANEASESLPSASASKNTDGWCSLTSSPLNESVYIEAVEVGSDIDQHIESRRLLGVNGRIGVWQVCKNRMHKRCYDSDLRLSNEFTDEVFNNKPNEQPPAPLLNNLSLCQHCMQVNHTNI